jgi:hypothetical protein
LWRKESGVKEDEREQVWFDAERGHRRKSKWRSKRESIRSGYGGSSGTVSVFSASANNRVYKIV